MHLKISKFIFVNLILSIYLNASEILSSTQDKLLELSSQKAQEDSAKLQKDWINPITYSYTYKKDKVAPLSKMSVLSINQPIFRSGGIYYAIKYANNIEVSSKISLDIQKKELIAKTLNIVYSIKKLDIQIKQQKLLLSNASIDVKNKNESVFNGLLDISFLNNAIISKNKTKLSLVNLQYQKNILVNNLKTLSDLTYDKITLPKLKIIDKNDFKNKNLNLLKSKLDIKNQNYLSGITNARYLPSVNVNYTKTYNHINENNGYNYGFSVVVPLDFKGLADSSSAKISYLKSKEQDKLNKIQEDNFFDSKVLTMKYIKSKKSLTYQNISAYSKLLKQTKELVDAQLKTKDDLRVLQNSKYIERLNLDIYNIDEQIELLDIYKRMNIDKI